ncbi:MAG: helix-turn-helix domain-containing protein [Propioniciclava sp.]
MSKHRVVVLKIVPKQLSVSEAADLYGLSRRQIYLLLARFHNGGIEAVEPRSRAPRSSPQAIPPEVADRIVQLRRKLTRDGMDAGPVTIAWHLETEGTAAPSPATIHPILTRAGLVTPEPRKRPRSWWTSFETAQPNGCWQSDFTHWRLANGSDVEILNWLDDHSRYLLSATVHTPGHWR